MLQLEDKEEIDQINRVDLNPWRPKDDPPSENIMNRINKNQNHIRVYTEVLNEDEKNEKKKENKKLPKFRWYPQKKEKQRFQIK